MNVIRSESVVSAKKGIAVADMDGETVMMCIDTGKYYNLGEVGGAIWALIGEPVSVEDVVAKLTDSYDIDAETCTKDVLEFLENINAKGLIDLK